MAVVNQTHLIEIAQSVLDALCDCLEGTPLGRPKDCFLSFGEANICCCDGATVKILGIRPGHAFPSSQLNSGAVIWDRCCDMGRIADMELSWVRPCYPILVNNATNPCPSPADEQNATEALLIDAMTVSCCLPFSNCGGASILGDSVDCSDIGWGELVPTGPEGAGCAGWKWHFEVELDSCCISGD